LQGALGLLARGELARQESEVLSVPDRQVEEARIHLRAAIKQLDELLEEVKLAQRRFSVPGGGRGGLTQRQLTSLERNIQYQLARACRNQGQSYPASSPDRAHSMTRAVDLLESLASLETSHPLGWKSRIDRMVCHRLLDDGATAARELQALLDQKPPPSIELRARAEGMLLALSAGRWEEVGAIMDRGRELGGVTSAELDYAWLKCYLERCREAGRAGDEGRAQELQHLAGQMIQRIHELHGAYWTRRAQMLMSVYVRQSPPSLEMWVQAAENTYRSGQFDEALEAYDRARTLAEEQGDRQRAFQLAETAAAIEHQRGRYGEAMARYRTLAVSAPENSQAPKAHLQAIYYAAQRVRESPSDSLEDYVALLAEHLQTWPRAPSSNQVRWLLGRLRQHQRDWENAIAAYRAIAREYVEYAQVVKAAGECYAHWLEELKAAGQATQAIAESAAEWFESLAAGTDGRMLERLGPLAQEALVSAARMRLDYTTGSHARTEQILLAALDRSPEASPQWTAAARALLVYSLAGQGKYDAAAAVLRQISSGPPGELLQMLERLDRVGSSADQDVQARLAELELDTIELVRPRRDQLDSQTQQALERIRAGALADAGRTQEALETYRQLSQAHPQDGAIQEAYAKLLSAGEDRATLEAALARWRDVARKSATGGDRWFHAKYALAQLHCRLGDKQKALAIIRQLEILHPEMGGPRMKQLFLDLRRECGR
jgi:tetratricopeptide (TPR) repeat protein